MDAITDVEINMLRRKNLVSAYIVNKSRFDEIGKLVYKELLKNSSSTSPTQQEVLENLEIRIHSTAEFLMIVKKDRFLKPKTYPGYARMLAKYMIQESWDIISTP